MNARLRVGLNLLYLLPGEVGGTETYAKGLLSGLAALPGDIEYRVFVNEESSHWPLPADERIARVVCPVRAASRSARYLFEQGSLPRLLKRQGVHVTHSLGYIAPLRCSSPSVVTVPDLNYRAFGDEMPPLRRAALAWFVRASVHRAAKVVAISEFVADELRRVFGLVRDHVFVTPLAAVRHGPVMPPNADWLAAHGIRQPYLIAFSSPSPNKNLHRLVTAHRTLVSAHGAVSQLVFVGHRPLHAIGTDRDRDRVVCTGYLDDGMLRRVLSGAQALVFPSLYEGFGLPILEAMQAGVPVVSSRAAALPEVGGEAALYFDPLSEAELVDRLLAITRDADLRSDLRHRGLARAAEFSWTRTARLTRAIYESVGVAAGLRPLHSSSLDTQEQV